MYWTTSVLLFVLSVTLICNCVFNSIFDFFEVFDHVIVHILQLQFDTFLSEYVAHQATAGLVLFLAIRYSILATCLTHLALLLLILKGFKALDAEFVVFKRTIPHIRVKYLHFFISTD